MMLGLHVSGVARPRRLAAGQVAKWNGGAVAPLAAVVFV
jgi:hypothetical protein